MEGGVVGTPVSYVMIERFYASFVIAMAVSSVKQFYILCSCVPIHASCISFYFPSGFYNLSPFIRRNI
jgi:hypothetical protein